MGIKYFVKKIIYHEKYEQGKRDAEQWKKEQDELIRNSNVTKKIISCLFKYEHQPYLIEIGSMGVKGRYEHDKDKQIWFSRFGVNNLDYCLSKKFITYPSRFWSQTSDQLFAETVYFDQIHSLARAICDSPQVQGQYRLKRDYIPAHTMPPVYCYLEKIGYNGNYYNKKRSW